MSRKALILGAGGFIGSHLARHLLESGWKVTAVVRDVSSPLVTRRLQGVTRDIDLVQADAASPDSLDRLVGGQDAVFPFAGRSGAAASMDAPLDDLDANGCGQLVVLEALRRRNPDARVVFPGSRLQYGRCERLPVTEDHPQRPLSIYGVHKMLGEHYHRLYTTTYGIPSTMLRISNPYGPLQDRPDHHFGVVGTFLARASLGQDIHLYGGGLQLRDYVYIDDLCRLCELAVTRTEAIGQVFNASGPRPVSLRQMAEAVVATVGRGRIVYADWPADVASVETGDYFGDTDRADRILGWSPEVELADGLVATWRALSPRLTHSR